MAYEKINDLSTDTVFKLGGVDKDGAKNPTKIEGFYLGVRSVQTPNGPATIHVFQTATGNQGIWGTKKLNDNLTKGLVGFMTLVVYKGKVKLQGGKTQHEYDMSVDKTSKIEVGTLGTTSDYDDSDETEEDSYDQDAAVIAADARKAQLEALLNRSGKGKTVKN